MPTPARVFRLFLSSTFIDFERERAALQRFVFPRLRDLSAAYGARFQAVDLRWGISAEAGEDQQTLNICLREVERCQRLTPRPNFLVLAGNRYGWRPLPPDIPTHEFDVVEAALESDDERAVVREWYKRDDNAAPPRYLLQRRSAAPGSREWAIAEPILTRALRAAVGRLDWPIDRTLRYISSATEREIAAGAFGALDAAEHVLSIRRQIEHLPTDARGNCYRDVLADGTADDEAAALNDDLHNRLSAYLGGNARVTTARWAGDGLSDDHVGSLPLLLDECLPLLDARGEAATVCEQVWRTLGGIIRGECSRDAHRSALDLERDAHARFRDERATTVIGRDAELARIASYLVGTNPAPLAVLGTFGSGKSALMARAVVEAEAHGVGAERPPSRVVVSRFVGATAESTNGVRLLGSIGADVAAAFGDAAEPPATLKDISDWLPRQLARASVVRPLVLVIDALDQLSANDGARTLAWLPHALPPGVRVVVSSAPGDVTAVLEGRQSASNTIRVEPLDAASGGAALDTWLRDASRLLTADQRTAVIASFVRSGLPLHLRLAFEESRRWRSWDAPVDLPGDPKDLIRHMFGRVSREANHGHVLVERTFGYLSAARNGLTEDELLDVLSLDPIVMADFRRRSPRSPATDRLPDVVWSRLYDEVEPYLTRRDADGTRTLGFFHRQLAEVAAEDFLREADRVDRHALLADYFTARPPTLGRGSPNLRRLSELPWHLAGAGRWDQFVETLSTLAFLDARLSTAGPQAVVDDLDLALDAASARAAMPAESAEALSTVRAFVRLTTHILGRDASQLAAQLAGRVDARRNPRLDRIVQEARASVPASALEPLTATLPAPGGDLIATLTGHRADVRGIDITPDGTLGVSASADGTVRIWDLDRQTERFVLPVGHGEVLSVIVTPDGRQLVSGSADGSIDVWNIASGARVRRWDGKGNWRSLAMTPDGTRLLSGCDGPASLWDFATAELLKTIKTGSGATIAIAVSADARRAVVGGVYDYVSLIDLESTQEVATLPQGHDTWISAVAITPDGRYALSSDWDGNTKIWDFDAKRQVGKLAGHGYKKIADIALTPAGLVATADSFGRIVLHRWTMEETPDGPTSKDVPLKIVDTTGHRVRQIAITPDGARAITAGEDGTLRVWNLTPQGERLPDWALHSYDSNDAQDARFDLAWRGVLTTETHASAPPALDARDFEHPTPKDDDWRVVPTIEEARQDDRDDDDRDRPAIGFRVRDAERKDRSPDIRTGRCLFAPLLSPDRQLLVAFTAERQVSVREVATGVERHSLPIEIGTAPSEGKNPVPDWVAFSADSRCVLYAIGEEVVVRDVQSGSIADLPEGSFVWQATAKGPRETSTRPTPDGWHLLGVLGSTSVALWRIGTPAPVATWALPPDARVELAIDGSCAWWFTRDGRLRRWLVKVPPLRDGRTGRVTKSFGRPTLFHVTAPATRVSEDGRFALALDTQGALKIWQLPKARPIVEYATPGTQSVAIATTKTRAKGLSGLIAIGGARLEVFDLASMRLVAALDADGAFTDCRFESPSVLAASTADGRRHRFRIRGVEVS